ncbi:MAG: hypothetical protein EOP53_10825 [Sphingobacteriales bacterium]|nr:MAG: hypothetical protein EOP53_10825 [Sphingobacteriales bacterium]
MQKIMVGLLFSCIVSHSYGQLQEIETSGWTDVGHLKRLGTTIAKMSFKASGSDTSYHLLMKDFTKQQEVNYFSVSFSNVDNTFGRLYDLLKSFFLSENKQKNYTRAFKLGAEGVHLQHTAVIGSKAVRLTTNDGYINLSEKDIDKVFGKR